MQPRRDQSVIEIAPVGEPPIDILEELLPVIEARFPGRVARFAPQGLPIPEDAVVPARRQYQAGPLLEQLGKLAHTERLLGVTDLDLFAPGLNFIFGQAQLGGPAAVMTLARLRPAFWGHPPNPALLQERAIKEAVHELGHTYGLQHCNIPACVMSFSNRLEETDHKTDRFCKRDEAQLRQALGVAA